MASWLTQMVRLPRCLSKEFYTLLLRMWYSGFFMAEKAYHVIAFATLHSGSYNKALTSHRGEKTVKGAHERKKILHSVVGRLSGPAIGGVVLQM
jgi:hypothetical protein